MTKAIALRESALATSSLAPESSPLFAVLGYYGPFGCEERYYFRVGQVTRCYRARDLASLWGLFSIHPDAAHWRGCFPRHGRMGIDTPSAAAYLIAECKRIGWYEPPDDLKPRLHGRPRGAIDTYQRARRTKEQLRIERAKDQDGGES